MVNQKKSGEIKSVFIESLDRLYKQRKEFLSAVNRTRWNRYENRGEVFGMKYGSVFPSSEWIIPKGDQFNILRENANYGWANAIWNAIMSSDMRKFNEDSSITKWNPDTSNYPSFSQNYLHLEPTDYKIKDNEVSVMTPNDSILFVFSVDSPEQFNDEWIRVKIEDNEKVEIYYEYDDTNPYSVDNILGKMKAEMVKKQQIALSVITASGAVEISQIESPKENDEFIELFNELELNYEKVCTVDGKDIYLISHSNRGKKIIDAYLEADDATFNDYLSLLGYPGDVSYFVDGNSQPVYQEKYDRYTSEEFVLYLVEEDKIDESELKYFAYCPYRPPPSEKQAQYAIQLGKQIEESVSHFCRVNDVDVESNEILTELKESTVQFSDEKPYKPLFMANEWPIKTNGLNNTDKKMSD